MIGEQDVRLAARRRDETRTAYLDALIGGVSSRTRAVLAAEAATADLAWRELFHQYYGHYPTPADLNGHETE